MGRFFKILCNDAHERPSFWKRFRRDCFQLLPTESLIASTLSGHVAVNFLQDLGFSAFLLRWLEICDPNDKFGLKLNLSKLNFLRNFACSFE